MPKDEMQDFLDSLIPTETKTVDPVVDMGSFLDDLSSSYKPESPVEVEQLKQDSLFPQEKLEDIIPKPQPSVVGTTSPGAPDMSQIESQEELDKMAYEAQQVRKLKPVTKTMKFEDHPVTPMKDEADSPLEELAQTFTTDIASGVSGAVGTAMTKQAQTKPPTLSGLEQEEEGYDEEVKSDQEAGKKVFQDLQKVVGEIKHEDFEFANFTPSKSSFDKIVRANLAKAYPEASNAELKGYSDAAFNYLMRNEITKRGSDAEYWKRFGEALYSTEEKLFNIYDQLDSLENTTDLSSIGMGDLTEIAKSWKEGGLRHSMDVAMGQLAVSNPEKASQIAATIDQVDREIGEGQDYGKVVGLLKNVASVMNPMLKTVAKSAVPVVGKAVAVNEWHSQATGDMFRQLVREGVDPQIASDIASEYAIPYAALSYAQVGQLANLAKGASKKAAGEALKKTMLEVAKKKAAQMATSAVVETVEEAGQAFIREVAVGTAKKIDGVTEEDIFDVTFQFD